jgi:uncharacterized membrane protein YjjP (DUF1212 family)
MVSGGDLWRSLSRPAEVVDLPPDAIRAFGTPELLPDAVEAQKVIRLCLRMGALLLDAGMAANDIVVVLLRVTHAYRVLPVHIDVMFTSITISYSPGAEAPAITLMRYVQPSVTDYYKAQLNAELCDKITLGLGIDEATAEFSRIRALPRRHPWWVSMVGNAAVGVGVALLYTTSVRVLLVTFVVSCLADRVVASLGRVRMPPFFVQVFAAAFITLLAAAVAYAGRVGVGVLVGIDPTMIVVGGIVVLVAGTLAVSAAQDAIDQFYVTAAARILETFMRTAGIVVGLLIGLAVAYAGGFGIYVTPDPIAGAPGPARLAGAMVASLGWALYGYAGRATVVLSTAMGLVAGLGYLAGIEAGFGEVGASALGAFLGALASTVLVRRSNVPAFALIASALPSLVPGLALYKGLLLLAGTVDAPADPAAGQVTLGLAMAVALAVAAGASFGTYIGRPLASQMRRIRDRTLRRPARPDGRA